MADVPAWREPQGRATGVDVTDQLQAYTDVRQSLKECDYPDKPCPLCGHEACGWCPECSPGVPEW